MCDACIDKAKSEYFDFGQAANYDLLSHSQMIPSFGLGVYKIKIVESQNKPDNLETKSV